MDQAGNVFGVVVLVAVAFFVVKGCLWLATFDERWWKRLLEGADSAWHQHVRFWRRELLFSLRLRDEAYANLDGGGLYVADEFARDALDALGGLAGRW